MSSCTVNDPVNNISSVKEIFASSDAFIYLIITKNKYPNPVPVGFTTINIEESEIEFHVPFDEGLLFFEESGYLVHVAIYSSKLFEGKALK